MSGHEQLGLLLLVLGLGWIVVGAAWILGSSVLEARAARRRARRPVVGLDLRNPRRPL